MSLTYTEQAVVIIRRRLLGDGHAHHGQRAAILLITLQCTVIKEGGVRRCTHDGHGGGVYTTGAVWKLVVGGEEAENEARAG